MPKHRTLCSQKQRTILKCERLQGRRVAFPPLYEMSVNHEFAGFDSLLPFSLFVFGNFVLY